MKKLVALLLALLCCLSCTAFAETPDFDSMTTADIYDLVSAGKAVLDYRASVTKDKTIIDQDGITISLGNPRTYDDSNKPYHFYNALILINDSGYDLTLKTHSVKMNGWTVKGNFDFQSTSYTLPDGTRTREASVWTSSVVNSAGISSWDELETYTWHFSFSQKISGNRTRSIELIVDCTYSPETGLTIARITPVGQ